MKLRSFPPAVALIIATAGIIAPAWADHHEEGPQLLRVASLQIKPDMVQEWEDLTKNHINPALKKAGVPWRVIWRTATFGHTFRYTSITPLKNFAALDGDSALARVLEPQELSSLLSRIFKCVASRRVYAVRTRPDVSITPEDPDPPKMALVIVSSIVPGKQVEYERWVKDEILPALTKAGAKHVMVSWFSRNGRVSAPR